MMRGGAAASILADASDKTSANELLGADCPFDMRGEIVASRRTAHAIRRHADFLACHDAYSFERRIPHLDKSGADVINAGGGCL